MHLVRVLVESVTSLKLLHRAERLDLFQKEAGILW